jgi:CubicO group peptidase (beta-lactamase class C family)
VVTTVAPVTDLPAAVDEEAEEIGFTGAVRVDIGGDTVIDAGYGLADRANAIPNTAATRFAMASGSKGFTALTVVRLVEEGALALDTTARSLLGADLPLVDGAVTIEHLLGHRSGIGDYLDADDDEGEITDYVLARPVHELATTEAFLPLLDGFPQKFAPDSDFSYCNGGYMVLAVLAERAGGEPFHDLVDRLVLAPAGLADTAYLRTDELPGGTALGYLATNELRTNVFHLPVRGNGDGGAFTTTADLHRFWSALLAGTIVSPDHVAEMIRPRSDVPAEGARYGLGFWLGATSDAIALLGFDAGVSLRTVHVPSTGTTWTMLSNTSDGAWPMARRLAELLGD